MRVRWLRRALANLEEEAQYIAAENPPAAARTVATIFAAVDRLARHPAMGRSGRVPGTRDIRRRRGNTNGNRQQPQHGDAGSLHQQHAGGED